MNLFWERFAPIAGGIFGSMQSFRGFVLSNMPDTSFVVEAVSLMPELKQAFIFGFIGGLAGWAAKKFGDTIICLLKKIKLKKSLKKSKLWKDQPIDK